MSDHPASSHPDIDALKSQIKEIIAKNASAEPSAVTDDALLLDDLGVDSLLALEIVFDVERQFNVTLTEDEARQLKTVADAVRLVASKLAPA
jgi:acyl carrier protein